jgi:glycosyltransferase involved in cell wall biosynthesis
MSGGDYHIFRVAKEWENTVAVTLVTSKAFQVSNVLALKDLYVKDPLPFLETNNPFLYMAMATVRASHLCFSGYKGDYTVVISPSHYVFNVIPAVFAKMKRKNVIFTVFFHDIAIAATDNPFRKLSSIFHNLAGLLTVRLFADLVFVINESSKNRCLNSGIPKEKIVKTSNAVDLLIPNQKGSEKRFSFDACFLGRLEKMKGVYDLVKVWGKVCSNKPSAVLVIMGDGPERAMLQKAVDDASLSDNIKLLGYKSGKEKYDVLLGSKIFISTSYVESWGIAVAEAMACSLPVVAYDLPAYREVFSDAFLAVPVGDTNTMASKIALLLQNPEMAIKVGCAGKNYVKRYNWGTVAEKELSNILKGSN